TIKGFFRRLTLADPSLRELPAAPAGASPKENLSVIADQDDPNVRPKAICIDRIGHVIEQDSRLSLLEQLLDCSTRTHGCIGGSCAMVAHRAWTPTGR